HCSHIRPVHPVHPPALIWISLDRWQLPPSPPDEIIHHHQCIKWTLSDTELHFLVPESQVRSILRQVAEKTNLDHVRTSQTLFVRAQCGYGVMGELPEPMPCSALFSALASHLPQSAWTMTGSLPEQISTLAYCPGSGMDLGARAFALGADVFISGDLKFHQAQELEALGLTLDVGHFSLEEKMMSIWAQILEQDLAQAGVEVTFIPGHNPLRRKTCPQ
ncbi:MAG: Nif3-like dinuclear metal center hexameric protein, partial [Desulfovermiculus sp.]|nr:Nif3-like dinuclear metal center hexameric protein [Desulfovermiculus sp.]